MFISALVIDRLYRETIMATLKKKPNFTLTSLPNVDIFALNFTRLPPLAQARHLPPGDQKETMSLF